MQAVAGISIEFVIYSSCLFYLCFWGDIAHAALRVEGGDEQLDALLAALGRHHRQLTRLDRAGQPLLKLRLPVAANAQRARRGA